MIDCFKIYVKAGDGGAGCNSFKGKKFTKSWYADGGSGGKGADIIIRRNRNLQGLEKFRFKHNFVATNGKCGQGNKKHGANAGAQIIEVPPGVIVRDSKDDLLLRDLGESEEDLRVAYGGAGGRGNTKARPATAGSPGERRELLLELKLVADIGLVGSPNAGKSTFLTKISSARPKIASFPFTTTTPFRAVLKFSDFSEPSALTIVEIPGLIKGADQGRGLGAQFLRHLARPKILVHLIDMAGKSGQEAFGDYQDLNQELKNFDQELINKPQVLVANKMDQPLAKNNLKDFSARLKKQIYPISALSGDGIEELVAHLRSFFHNEEKGITQET
ncbi:MAG: Obg family GTPase CgtA [Candidatus Omnitrophica bacterium]|nr:Obg family GTPase CgtA [Candidatus Omnitrophota bacterium]